jgi:phenylalanyl-tRNA synthetase alpha chain
MEIMGCGLVHPAVLESAGLDSERYSGWAFGMGPGRIAMSRYGINDIRLLYDSDVRFLEQFAAC